MSKKVTYKETTHQWSGTAVVKKGNGVYEPVELGVVTTPLKLKETGVRALFEKEKIVPVGTISIEVEKNTDVVIEYEMEVDEFKKVAKALEPKEETPVEEGQEQAQ